MTTYPATPALRSTEVKIYTDLCPLALKLYGENIDDRTIFGTGVAAHDVAHAIGLYPDKDPEEVARVVVKRLIATGRLGIDAEGPLQPDAALAGRDIFLSWIYHHGGDPHPHPEAQYEPGMGFRVEGLHWEPTKYGAPGSTFKIRPDVVYQTTLSGEEGWGTGLVTRDYKTSWAAGADTLDTMQLRAQAVAVWHDRHRYMRMEPDFIRREVINLRSGATYTADTWTDAGGRELFQRWGEDVLTVISAINEGGREPRIGQHCLKCHYLTRCDARATNHGTDLEAMAEEYVLAVAKSKELKKQLRAATVEDAIEFSDRSYVGFFGKVARKPADDVHQRVWEQWAGGLELGSAADSTARGALQAMKLGKTQLDNLAKALHPDGDDKKARRLAWVESMTKPVTTGTFGIWPKKK